MAGDTAEIIATLQNRGDTVDQLTLSIEGADPEWYSLPVSSVALFPNDKDDLKITFHIPKGDQLKAGAHRLKVNVASQENPSEEATAELTINIQEMFELELAVSPEEVVGRKGTYQVVVANPGNATVTVYLKASDAQNRLRYQFHLEQLEVEGGSRAGTTLQVRLGWLAKLGGERALDFHVAAMLPEEARKPSPDFCSYCGQKLKPDLTHSRVFCPHCQRKLREGAKAVGVRFVRTPLIGGMPRIRIPWFTRSPVINSFNAATEDKREFTLTWSVKRSQEVRLNDEVVPAIGERVFHPSAATTSTLTAINKGKSVTQTLQIDALPIPQAQSSERIRASLASDRFQAQAGLVPAMAMLHLQNLGEIVDKFLVEIHGIDSSWYTRSASSVALMPQANDQVQITFQPPKKQGVKSGEYPFAITVRSESASEEATVVLGQLEIMPAPAFRVEVRPFRAQCRKKGKFRVNLINTSVTDIDLRLDATDMEEGCKFEFENDQVKLPAWGNIEIPMVVKPQRGSFVGDRKPYDITVNATDGDGTSQKATCQLNHQPRFSSWKSFFRFVRAVITIAVVGTAAYLAIHWGGGWDQLTDDPGEWWRILKNGDNAPWGD